MAGRVPQTLIKYRRGIRMRFERWFGVAGDCKAILWNEGTPYWIVRIGMGDVRLATTDRTVVAYTNPARLKAVVATPDFARLVVAHEHRAGHARLAIVDADGELATTDYADSDGSVGLATDGHTIVASAHVAPLVSSFTHALAERRPWPLDKLHKRLRDPCTSISAIKSLGDAVFVATRQSWSRWSWGGTLLDAWPAPVTRRRMYPASTTDRREIDWPLTLIDWHPRFPLIQTFTDVGRSVLVEWDLEKSSGREIGDTNERVVAARSSDGRYVVADRVDSGGRGLYLWDSERGEIVERLETRRYGVSAMTFRPGTREVAVATSEGVFSLDVVDKRAAKADLDEMLAQHAAAPWDLELRSVIADGLLEIGDPRGELITIQTAIADGTADKPATRRAAELIAQHADSWTNVLPRIDRSSRRFARGFLVAAKSTADQAELERSLHRAEWATLEELEVETPNVLPAIVGRMPLLRAFSFRYDFPRPTPDASYPTLLALGCSTWIPPDLKAFPNVRVLGGTWARSAPSLERHRALLERLAALGIQAIVHRFSERFLSSDAFGTAIRVRDAGPPEIRFALGAGSGTFDARGWAVRLRRDSDRADLSRGRDPDEPFRILPTVLDLLLENGIRACAFHVPAEEVDPVKAVALRHRMDVSFDGPVIELSRP